MEPRVAPPRRIEWASSKQNFKEMRLTAISAQTTIFRDPIQFNLRRYCFCIRIASHKKKDWILFSRYPIAGSGKINIFPAWGALSFSFIIVVSPIRGGCMNQWKPLSFYVVCARVADTSVNLSICFSTIFRFEGDAKWKLWRNRSKKRINHPIKNGELLRRRSHRSTPVGISCFESIQNCQCSRREYCMMR